MSGGPHPAPQSRKRAPRSSNLLPRPTNVRRIFVDNSTTPVTFWVGSNHRRLDCQTAGRSIEARRIGTLGLYFYAARKVCADNKGGSTT